MRFLLHEMDLEGPIVSIGRSDMCHITLDDALASREHAVIRLGPSGAYVRDLQSRNGVLVNGVRIQAEVRLSDRDRVRIGAQEMVFCIAADRKKLPRPTRATAQMVLCGSCATAYPSNAAECPHCGASQSREEITAPHLDVKQNRDWALTLLAESVERALITGDHGAAERAMMRSAAEIDMAAQAGDRLSVRMIDLFATLGLRLAVAMQGSRWLEWALSTLMQHSLAPSTALADSLEQALGQPIDVAAPVLASFALWWEVRAESPEGSHMRVLDRLRRSA
jgi:hypothetical protein